MPKDHTPHMLRQHRQEWCGGTQPPTLVTVHSNSGELFVDVFPEEANLHIGQVLPPTGRQEFAIAQDVKLTPTEIGAFALRAISSPN